MQCTTDVTPVYVTARPMDYWIARLRACEGNQVGAFCGNVWRGKRRAAAACTVALLCLAPLLYAHQSVVACLAVRRAEF
jgi:hypothetical protein